MSSKSKLNQSFSNASRVRMPGKYVFITLLLVGVTIACAPTARIPSSQTNADANSPSSTLTSGLDPFTSFGTGHDFGAIYGLVDPGVFPHAYVPPFPESIAGEWVLRSTELGPLTQPVGGSILTGASGQASGSFKFEAAPAQRVLAAQPTIRYSIAQNILIRRSELGPLAEPAENSMPASAQDQNPATIIRFANPLENQCSLQPSLPSTIAGVTIMRPSELGPLTDRAGVASITCIP